MNEVITPFDLQRMLVGNQPILFYVEIIARTLIIYIYALVLLRWLGSRTIGQLSTIEFLLVIALGSAVGDPMFYPEVPLLQALLVITILILANKGLDLIVARFHWSENAIDGRPVEVIKDGIINYHQLHVSLLGQSEFFQQLRLNGIANIGEVKCAYLEPDGRLSVFKQTGDKFIAGLGIVPPWEIDMPETLSAGQTAEQAQNLACQRCSQPLQLEADKTVPPCPRCAHARFSVLP